MLKLLFFVYFILLDSFSGNKYSQSSKTLQGNSYSYYNGQSSQDTSKFNFSYDTSKYSHSHSHSQDTSKYSYSQEPIVLKMETTESIPDNYSYGPYGSLKPSEKYFNQVSIIIIKINDEILNKNILIKFNIYNTNLLLFFYFIINKY